MSTLGSLESSLKSPLVSSRKARIYLVTFILKGGSCYDHDEQMSRSTPATLSKIADRLAVSAFFAAENTHSQSNIETDIIGLLLEETKKTPKELSFVAWLGLKDVCLRACSRACWANFSPK